MGMNHCKRGNWDTNRHSHSFLMLTLTIPALLRLNKSFLVHTVLLLPYLEPATNPGIGIRGCVPVCDGCWSPYPGSVITPSSGPRVRVWGHMVSADREPITGVLVQSPQRGARAEPLVRGSNWCRQLFLHLHNLTNWPICPKIRVFAKQKISSDVWGRGMPPLPLPLNPPVITPRKFSTCVFCNS